jgi:hypothetical protein
VQPTSPLADDLRLRNGGWVVSQHGDRHASFETFEDAAFFAKGLGTTPNMWSVDNPRNARFAPTRSAA